MCPNVVPFLLIVSLGRVLSKIERKAHRACCDVIPGKKAIVTTSHRRSWPCEQAKVMRFTDVPELGSHNDTSSLHRSLTGTQDDHFAVRSLALI
jgi:hypothetical protein